MKNKRLILAFAVLLIASLACGLFGGSGSAGSEGGAPSGEGGEPQQGAPPPSGPGKYDTAFPMPPEAPNTTCNSFSIFYHLLNMIHTILRTPFAYYL